MPVAKPLYQQPVRIPSWKPAPLSVAVQLVGGSNAIPQNFKAQHMSLRANDRLSPGAKQGHRGITEVGLTSGLTDGAKKGPSRHRTYSQKEKRALAVKVLRNRGQEITKKAINEILSGKTL